MIRHHLIHTHGDETCQKAACFTYTHFVQTFFKPAHCNTCAEDFPAGRVATSITNKNCDETWNCDSCLKNWVGDAFSAKLYTKDGSRFMVSETNDTFLVTQSKLQDTTAFVGALSYAHTLVKRQAERIDALETELKRLRADFDFRPEGDYARQTVQRCHEQMKE